MAIERGAIVFKQGEHPSLELDGHRFRRFSAKISGSHHGNVEKYLDEIKIIARRHFGWRVLPWHELDHLSLDNRVYGWDEVYAARKEEWTANYVSYRPQISILCQFMFNMTFSEQSETATS